MGDQKVTAITSNCGYFLNFHAFIADLTEVPVMLSPLTLLPTLIACYELDELIAVVTGVADELEKYAFDVLKNPEAPTMIDDNLLIVGCDKVPDLGKEIVEGLKIDMGKATPGLVELCKKVVKENPKVRAFVFEATELPPFAAAVRQATNLPVFDAVNMCNFVMDSCYEPGRFGNNSSTNHGPDKHYFFGDNLHHTEHHKVTELEKALKLKAQHHAPPKRRIVENKIFGNNHLGIIGLDYYYKPALGDIWHADTFKYPVRFRVTPQLSFEKCQKGDKSPEMVAEIKRTIDWFEKQKVTAITSNCGFFMNYQDLVSKYTDVPTILSSLILLPSIASFYETDEQIAVVTANGESLKAMFPVIMKHPHAGNLMQDNLIVVGCEKVPHFGYEVAMGFEVDVEKAMPHMVERCVSIQKENPQLRAFLFECTELPPYSAEVRRVTGLPVFDAVTMCNFVMDARYEPNRFDRNAKTNMGPCKNYKFGDNLSALEKTKSFGYAEAVEKGVFEDDRVVVERASCTWGPMIWT